MTKEALVITICVCKDTSDLTRWIKNLIWDQD